jgi:FAD/FMN-containing dehydrogenase
VSVDQLLDSLRAAVGPANVLVHPDSKAPFEVDWTGRYRGTALAVVRPASTPEVVAVLRTCTAGGTAVVPQGGNTGLVGGSVPRGGEIVLSTRRLATIDPVEHAEAELIAGAGVTLEQVHDRAGLLGWDLGVDLASRGSATIGGMIATNAGGQHVARYGPMQHQVIGVEAVLADGAVIGRVPALRKDNTGYHWDAILSGSEGTLAVVTRAHLTLVPALPERVVALCGVDDLDAALRVAGALRLELDTLLALEVVFADGLELVRAYAELPEPFPTPCTAYLTVECGGPAGSTERMINGLAGVLGARQEVRASAVASDTGGCARLRAYREMHTEAIAAEGIAHKLDVTLPFDRLGEFDRLVRARIAAVAPSARTFVFGHAGDGNLHVNVLGPAADDSSIDDLVLTLAASMGGSISAEHGIGVAKRDVLALSRTAADIEAMRSVKRALDPRGILNPGVIFAPNP